jgi:hypothetical protein
MKVSELFETILVKQSASMVTEGGEFGSYYYEKIAKILPAGLKSDDAILDAGFKAVSADLGAKKAKAYFGIDADFASDLVSAYLWWEKQSAASKERLQ